MKKGAGVLTLAATLLAGVIVHSRVSSSDAGATASATKIPAVAMAGEGPWIASCSYWSAAQTAAPAEPKTAATKEETPCASGGSVWGVPDKEAKTVEVSAVIATVPDPIHSHLALDFDRAIDALLLAAADNHYLSSYYWLPWHTKSGAAASGSGDGGSSAGPSDSVRERQPGLIVLRYAPTSGDLAADKQAAARRSYERVVYLFLVAETPALGVNGTQLQNAMRYQKALKTERFPAANAALNTAVVAEEKETAKQPCSAGNSLYVIGPAFSGSSASLHAGIDAAFPPESKPCISISGMTSTDISVEELDPKGEGIYRSFGEDTNFEQSRFLQSLASGGYDLSRVAVLSEAGTVFGDSGAPAKRPTLPKRTSTRPAKKEDAEAVCTTCQRPTDKWLGLQGTVLHLSFPRELSLLRNAEASQPSKPDPNAPPSPYLDLSLKDYDADDTVERFSTNQSPLSIEAQLMTIARELQRARSQFIVISASNVLDDLFLSQFLHRACPDARLVVLDGGDLLFERDVENAPYIGSIAITPYLLSSFNFSDHTQWPHASFREEETYNAALVAFHQIDPSVPPILSGYQRSTPATTSELDGVEQVPTGSKQVPLWAAIVGSDGYYPLAVMNWCASDQAGMLPSFSLAKDKSFQFQTCTERNGATGKGGEADDGHLPPESIGQNSGISPSLPWYLIATLVSLASLCHCLFLLIADLWSPFTRDFAIHANDMPHRRAVYLNIGASVLAVAGFVTCYPVFRVWHYLHIAYGTWVLVAFLLASTIGVCACTGLKTWRYLYHPRCRTYAFFNVLAGVAFLGCTGLWMYLCSSDELNHFHNYAGLYFSYRCLRPLSGVSPLLPILLLLLAWYCWSVLQTARLRFSPIHRPRIPGLVALQSPYEAGLNAYPLYVPDETLAKCGKSTDNCLYANITCLLITRTILGRFLSKRVPGRFVDRAKEGSVDLSLGLVYIGLFCVCLFAFHLQSPDRFVFQPLLFDAWPTSYELLLKGLFFPLLMVALSGWIRVIFIWGALNRGLLEPLERMPLRFAFTRFKGGSWVSMLQEKGLHIRWRDMGRSTEAIRQIVHHPDLHDKPELRAELAAQYQRINTPIHELLQIIGSRSGLQAGDCHSDELWDLPQGSADLCRILHIEQGYADFSKLLIEGLLAEYWDQCRTGFVEDAKEPESKETAPTLIQAAEELLVIRYVALIRAVLINIRFQMLLVATAFVLALIAWNSYPFQPHALIDWCFTFLLVTIGGGFIWVFAQMHRSAILSRITNTEANELGLDFYVRLLTFGAVPVLTWLAYQFPEIGGSLYRIVQPGLQVVK